MVLIYGESTSIKGKVPSIMKILEEKKRTFAIFTTPLKEIGEESQNIVKEEKIPTYSESSVISEDDTKRLLASIR